MESTKFTKVTRPAFGRRLSGKLFFRCVRSVAQANPKVSPAKRVRRRRWGPSLRRRRLPRARGRTPPAGRGGAYPSAAAGSLECADGHWQRAAVGPVPPPRPALSRARTDTGSGPRWGRSLRRGRLARARARKKIRENGIATPTSLDIPSQNARRSLREKLHS